MIPKRKGFGSKTSGDKKIKEIEKKKKAGIVMENHMYRKGSPEEH